MKRTGITGNRHFASDSDVEAEYHVWQSGGSTKYYFYGFVNDLLRQRRTSYQRVEDITGIAEHVVRDRVRYLRQLEQQS